MIKTASTVIMTAGFQSDSRPFAMSTEMCSRQGRKNTMIDM
jgi:hypothetical protein